VLSVFLACDDPYETASLLTDELGWRLVFATPRESDDRLACVGLGDAEVMLSTADEQFLAASSRPHGARGSDRIYLSGCLPPRTSPRCTPGTRPY
jgi:hypothetical protein